MANDVPFFVWLKDKTLHFIPQFGGQYPIWEDGKKITLIQYTRAAQPLPTVILKPTSVGAKKSYKGLIGGRLIDYA